MTQRRALLLYIEPTPYIIELIKKIRMQFPGELEAFYISENLSQDWRIELTASCGKILPVERWRAVSELWRSLNQLRRTDVVHLAGWGHPLLLAALLIGKLRRLHVSVESDTSRGQAIRGWKKLIKDILYPRLFRLADHFLPGGKRAAAYLASYGVPDSKITIAQMTVDVEAIRHYVASEGEASRASLRARLGFSGEMTAVLYIGRLEPWKGVADLFDAYAGVSARREDVRLMVAGSGSLSPLASAAAACDASISYLGRLSGSKVLDAYLASDVVVMPSHFEPWGLVINEAMACGRPVIVTDRVGCVDDLVTQGETGLIVPGEAPRALANAIEILAANDRLREEMGMAAKRKISRWTLQNEAENIVRCWSKQCDHF